MSDIKNLKIDSSIEDNKNYDKDHQEGQNTENLPKKRGRKPKNVTQSIDPIIATKPEIKEVKRRGRRPTCKIYEDQPISDEKIANIQQDECVIVHLPISKKDIELLSANKKIEKEIKQNCLDDYDPLAFFKPNIDQKQNSVSSTALIKPSNICALEKKIKELEAKLHMTKISNSEKKTLSACIKLENIYSGKNIWEYDNNICCRWCLHTFDTLPIGIPDKYDVVEKKYYVFNYYCSFNCALAHNLTYYDYNMINRISLLHHMRNKIFYNCNPECDIKILGDIIPAPPQDMLYMFGGPLTIDQFRDSSIVFKKQYILRSPNVITIEKYFIENNSQDSNKNAIKNKNKDLILARPIHLPAKGNIMAMMPTSF